MVIFKIIICIVVIIFFLIMLLHNHLIRDKIKKKENIKSTDNTTKLKYSIRIHYFTIMNGRTFKISILNKNGSTQFRAKDMYTEKVTIISRDLYDNDHIKILIYAMDKYVKFYFAKEPLIFDDNFKDYLMNVDRKIYIKHDKKHFIINFSNRSNNSNNNSSTSNKSKSNNTNDDQYHDNIHLRFFKLHKNSGYNEYKKRYYQWAKKYHPDSGGSLEKMKIINYHYGMVKDYFGEK